MFINMLFSIVCVTGWGEGGGGRSGYVFRILNVYIVCVWGRGKGRGGYVEHIKCLMFVNIYFYFYVYWEGGCREEWACF